jgi:allantoin racemase
MNRVLYIIPVTSDSDRIQRVKKRFESIAAKDTEVNVTDLPGAPTNLEFRKNEHEAVNMIIRKYEEGFYEGFNSIAIGCFYDPGVNLLREIMEIPVVGPGQASLTIASQLGSRIGLIVGKERWLPQIMDNAKLYGLEKYIWGWEEINLGVDDMHESIEENYEKVILLGKKLINDKKCDVIVLACTAIEGVYSEMIKRLGVPVIDASIAAFKFAEMMASLNSKTGLKVSKLLTYAN